MCWQASLIFAQIKRCLAYDIFLLNVVGKKHEIKEFTFFFLTSHAESKKMP
jgi:hypothetical protein